jgi:Zn-dependent protease with chaperone function
MRLENVEDLDSFELPVVLLPDFGSLPEAHSHPAVRLTPAAYQVRERRIVVNGPAFFVLEADVAEAVLAHEIGHGAYHRDSSTIRTNRYGMLGECIVADLLACRWGFFEGLRKERLQSYGLQYCQILELWPNESEYIARMETWYQCWLAGLIRRE